MTPCSWVRDSLTGPVRASFTSRCALKHSALASNSSAPLKVGGTKLADLRGTILTLESLTSGTTTLRAKLSLDRGECTVLFGKWHDCRMNAPATPKRPI